MKDCCSNQEETFGEIFVIIVENYKVFSLIFLISIVLVIIKYFIDKKKIKED
jgi:hypothetical protein